MEAVLNNLQNGEILYTTANGTDYIYIDRSQDNGVKYRINSEPKILPLNTIMSAFVHHLNGIEINRQWYINFDAHEYETRPCNLYVLLALLSRTDNQI
jgi:hypothetical protein